MSVSHKIILIYLSFWKNLNVGGYNDGIIEEGSDEKEKKGEQD